MTDSSSRRITIFDTTLRDGEQSPGASMNLKEKLEVAQALVLLGVDVIEAGFPIASDGDFEAVEAISQQVRGAVICGLARCRDADIDRAWQALRSAPRPRIHVFLATSAIHREHKLKMNKEQIIERAVESVRRAKGYCDDIEFSPEDAARTESDFLAQVVEAAIAAGATTVNIPDTVGYATPSHMGSVIRRLREKVANIQRAVISVHCHNDLGLAVANSLAAIENGAGQVECTVNGLGERAGNCSLEEIVMALRTRHDYYHAHTQVNTRRIVPTSRLVAGITGIQVQRNKAIVGQNAFAHESGIHQDGMLKEPSTYEIMRPEDVGLTRSDLVMGKHSGRAALVDHVKHMGYDLTREQIDELFTQFKALADKKKSVYDADLAALIEQMLQAAAEAFTLVSYEVQCGTGHTPRVSLKIRRSDGQLLETTASLGDGPVDAIFLAIEQLTGITVHCTDFNVHSLTVGKDAQGEVMVAVEHSDPGQGGRLYRGRGVSTDSVEASVRAFLNAINRIAARNDHATEPAETSAADASKSI